MNLVYAVCAINALALLLIITFCAWRGIGVLLHIERLLEEIPVLERRLDELSDLIDRRTR